MDPESKIPKERSGILSMLNVAIEDLNLAKNGSTITLAKAVFSEVGDLLPAIRVSRLSTRARKSVADQHTQDSMVDRKGYVKLGLACADVCRALDRGLDSRQADQLTRSVLEAIEQLAT